MVPLRRVLLGLCGIILASQACVGGDFFRYGTNDLYGIMSAEDGCRYISQPIYGYLSPVAVGDYFSAVREGDCYFVNKKNGREVQTTYRTIRLPSRHAPYWAAQSEDGWDVLDAGLRVIAKSGISYGGLASNRYAVHLSDSVWELRSVADGLVKRFDNCIYITSFTDGRAQVLTSDKTRILIGLDGQRIHEVSEITESLDWGVSAYCISSDVDGCKVYGPGGDLLYTRGSEWLPIALTTNLHYFDNNEVISICDSSGVEKFRLHASLAAVRERVMVLKNKDGLFLTSFNGKGLNRKILLSRGIYSKAAIIDEEYLYVSHGTGVSQVYSISKMQFMCFP